MPGSGRSGLRVFRFSGGNGLSGRGEFRKFRGFLNSMNVLVRDFPAEVIPLAALLHVLFQEDRAPGIRREGAGRGQKGFAHAILNCDFTAQKLSKRRHSFESAWGVTRGSIVLTGCYFAGCGKLLAAGFVLTTRSPAISTNSAEKKPNPRIAATTGVTQNQP